MIGTVIVADAAAVASGLMPLAAVTVRVSAPAAVLVYVLPVTSAVTSVPSRSKAIVSVAAGVPLAMPSSSVNSVPAGPLAGLMDGCVVKLGAMPLGFAIGVHMSSPAVRPSPSPVGSDQPIHSHLTAPSGRGG